MTPVQTGIAMLPGGLATAISIVFCAVITSRPKASSIRAC